MITIPSNWSLLSDGKDLLGKCGGYPISAIRRQITLSYLFKLFD